MAHTQREKLPGTCLRTDCFNPADPGYKSCATCRAKRVNYEATPGHREKRRAYKQAVKREVFAAYGGAICVCCGEMHMEFLSIDHVDGDGAEHRKTVHQGNLYFWLKAHGFPPGFRVLCLNCNFSLGHYGYCPHGTLTQPFSCTRKDRLPDAALS